MLAVFDLSDCADVVERSDDIVDALRSGQIPCDGAEGWSFGELLPAFKLLEHSHR